MKNVMIPEELFGKIIKYHLLDQEQEADDIRKGLEKKLDAMVNREAYSKFKTAPTEEEREKFRYLQPYKSGGHAGLMCTSFAPLWNKYLSLIHI